MDTYVFKLCNYLKGQYVVLGRKFKSEEKETK